MSRVAAEVPVDGRVHDEPPRRGDGGAQEPTRASPSLAEDLGDLLSRAQGVAFALLATLAVTSSSPDRYVGDNRFDQYAAPGHRLVRSLFIWDPTRGLGAVREDLWPIQVAPLALLRGLGLDQVATQRVWHVALLIVAATGAAAVLSGLGAGWHQLVVAPTSSLDRIRLNEGRPARAPDPEAKVRTLDAGPESLHLRVDAPDAGVLLTGQSWDDRWVATVDGRDLGPAAPYDTLGGWAIPVGEAMGVQLEFPPARGHRASLGVALVAAVACVALVVGGGPRRRSSRRRGR